MKKDTEDIQIELPENLKEVAQQNKPVKRSRFYKLFVITILLSIIAITGGFAYIKYKYNDNFIKDLLITTLSVDPNLQVTIGSLQTDWFEQSILIKNICFKPKNGGNDSDLIKLGRVNAKFDLFKTVEERSFYADVFVDSFELNILRLKLKNSSSKKPKYTTNISTVLNNLVDLPWKRWLGDINWRTAGGKIQITNSSITARDSEGILESCSLSDININLSRAQEDISGDIKFKGVTPNSASGTFSLDLKALLNNNTHSSANKYFSFLNDIKINGNVNNIDIPYMLRYFGWNKVTLRKTSLELTQPISMNLNIESDSMSSVAVDLLATTNSIGRIIHNNKAIVGTPSALAKIDCNLDLSNTWTEINPMNISLAFGKESSNLVNITSHVNGNFGEEFIITMNASTDLTALSKSSLGKLINSDIYGKINHSFAGNWKRDGVWKGNYTVSGDNITTILKGEKVSLPLHGNFDILVSKSKLLTPLQGQFDFEIESRSFKLKSIKPLFVDFQDLSSKLSTEIEFYADLSKIYDTTGSFLKSYNIGRINEIVKGTVTADTSGKVKYDIESASTSSLYKKNKVYASGDIAFLNNNNIKIKTVIHDLMKNINFKLDGNIDKSNPYWQANLTQSGILNLDFAKEVATRFSGFLGNNKIPLEAKGIIRQAVNANISYKSPNDIKVAMSFRTNIENLKTEIRNHPLNEEEVSIKSSLKLKKSNDDLLITIEQFGLNTADSTVTLGAGEYNLSTIKSVPWRDALRALPSIHADLSIGKSDMDTIGRIIKNRIAILYFLDSSVDAKFTSTGAKAEILSFKYKSPLISVESHKKFTIEPIVMTNRIIEKKWFNIQDSLSDVDLTLVGDLYEWKSFVPKIAVDVTSKFKARALYYHKNDRLDVKMFQTLGPERDELLVPKISFNGTVDNFFETIGKFHVVNFLNSIVDNIHISNANISVAQLKLLSGDKPGSNIRALQGKYIEISDLTASHSNDSQYISLSGSMSAKSSYFSRTYDWPILSFDGSVSTYKNPLVLKMNSRSIEAKGNLDLTSCDIQFNALAPYKYMKPSSIPLKLDFSVGIDSNNISKVASASLVGGPLAVTMNGLTFEPIGDRFKLALDSLKLDGPLTAKLDGIILDSSTDLFKGRANIAPVDLSKLQQSIGYNFPIRISGTFGETSLNIDDSYWKYFSTSNTPLNSNRIPNNFAKISTTSITLSSSDSASDESITFAFEHGKADTSIGSILLSNATVDNPKGYSNVKAVDAETIRIKPDFQTIFSDNVIINRIDIDKLNAYYEVAFKKSNIDALKEIVSNIFSTSNGTGPNAGNKKTLIKDLYVKDGTVRVSSTLFRGSASLPLPLNLHLENIGGDNTGETLASGFGKVFSGIGKVGLGVAGGVGGVIGGVGGVGKSIITAPLKLFKKFENDVTEDQE